MKWRAGSGASEKCVYMGTLLGLPKFKGHR